MQHSPDTTPLRVTPAVQVWDRTSEQYPADLLQIPHAPARLYALGSATTLKRPRIAIVGTRTPTAYGLRMANALAAGFARAGVCVVSGMARGIDAAAHHAALENHGYTAAVLGTGVDVPYPRSHRELHATIAMRGVVLSELRPGSPAHQGSFPRRNRIIAGLASMTIVVEAGEKSGALDTAKHALESGRTLAVVPGPMDSPQSVGSNRLIRDGATLLATLDEAFTFAGVIPPAVREAPKLTPTELAVWNALRDGPVHQDRITEVAPLSIRDSLSAITSLELQGLVECTHTGELKRR